MNQIVLRFRIGIGLRYHKEESRFHQRNCNYSRKRKFLFGFGFGLIDSRIVPLEYTGDPIKKFQRDPNPDFLII